MENGKLHSCVCGPRSEARFPFGHHGEPLSLELSPRSLGVIYPADVDFSGIHAFKFKDGVLLLSDSRLLLLALKLNVLEDSIAETVAAVKRAEFKFLRRMVPTLVAGAPPADPCAWNLLLRRR